MESGAIDPGNTTIEAHTTTIETRALEPVFSNKGRHCSKKPLLPQLESGPHHN